MPWPPTAANLSSENFECSVLLDLFLRITLNGSEKSTSDRTERLKQSFSQDLTYVVTNGRIKSPRSILFPYHIKSLTNNTELINLTCRLGHGISYSLLGELCTEIPYRQLEVMEEGALQYKLKTILTDSRNTITEEEQPYNGSYHTYKEGVNTFKLTIVNRHRWICTLVFRRGRSWDQ